LQWADLAAVMEMALELARELVTAPVLERVLVMELATQTWTVFVTI